MDEEVKKKEKLCSFGTAHLSLRAYVAQIHGTWRTFTSDFKLKQICNRVDVIQKQLAEANINPLRRNSASTQAT